MKIERLTLTNFRGVKHIDIDLAGKIDHRIVTLIGLNESGKTTILEGLSYFPSSDEIAASVIKVRESDREIASFVPLNEEGIFTGRTSISATLLLSDTDRAMLRQVVTDRGKHLDTSREIQRVSVSKQFDFQAGEFVPSEYGSSWGGVKLYIRDGSRGKYHVAESPGPGDDHANNLWSIAAQALRASLPNFVYFPNFIADVPRRIYISPFAQETPVNKFYRRILTHMMLDAGDEHSLESLVLGRINKYRVAQKSGDRTWISKLQESPDKDKIDAVFGRLSKVMTDDVIGSWSRIFNRPTPNTTMDIKWAIDPENEQPYIQIKISDGISSYHLHQRSLGFRWFFSFLLFTRFGRDRSKSNVFLLDEPAANLHAKAQAELLESFDRLTQGGDVVIYSTHSHHMIRPEWLSGAYIVENEAINYDAADVIGIEDHKTNIKVTSYRRFVGEHGSRISYYQPVIERLEYIEPSIVARGHQILVEGISDFHALTYVVRRGAFGDRLSIVPGTGSGSLSAMIQIALSRGHRFLVLLDDDEAGKREATRYRDRFYLLDSDVCTVGDLDDALTGKCLEGLISDGLKARIAQEYGNSAKKSIGNYLAELAATNRDNGLDEETFQGLSNIVASAARRLGLKPTKSTESSELRRRHRRRSA